MNVTRIPNAVDELLELSFLVCTTDDEADHGLRHVATLQQEDPFIRRSFD